MKEMRLHAFRPFKGPFGSEWTRVPFADLSGGPYCPRRTIRGWPHEGPEGRRGGIGGGGIAGPQQGTQLNLLKQTVKTQRKRSPLTS